MNDSLRKMTLLCLLAVFACGLSACNTIKGAGRDIERAGEEIQDVAD